MTAAMVIKTRRLTVGYSFLVSFFSFSSSEGDFVASLMDVPPFKSGRSLFQGSAHKSH